MTCHLFHFEILHTSHFHDLWVRLRPIWALSRTQNNEGVTGNSRNTNTAIPYCRRTWTPPDSYWNVSKRRVRTADIDCVIQYIIMCIWLHIRSMIIWGGCWGFGRQGRGWSLKVACVSWVSSYRNDFALVGLSVHRCRFPHLQVGTKQTDRVSGLHLQHLIGI